MIRDLLFIFLFLNSSISLLRADDSSPLSRNKRFLIWPPGTHIVQLIMAVGVPVDLKTETVIFGWSLKTHYNTINNVSEIFQPYPPIVRMKRTPTPSRWKIYKILEQILKSNNMDGKACLLRAICEFANSKIERSFGGLADEIIHLIFDPSRTSEDLGHYLDSEYHAARKLGKEFNGNCQSFFPDCNVNLLDIFTVLENNIL